MFVRAPLVFFQQVERVARVEGKGWFARDRHRCFPEVCIAAIVDNEEGGFVLHVGGEDEIVNVKVFHIRDRDVFLPIDRQRVAAVGGWEAEVSMSVSDRAVERGALQIGCGRAFDEDDVVVRRGDGARTTDHLFLDRAAGNRDGVVCRGAFQGIAAEDATGWVTAAIDRTGRYVHLIVLHGALRGAAAVDAQIRMLEGAAGDRDGVVRHVAIPGIAAEDTTIFDRAACERDGVVFHGAIYTGKTALGALDGAAGDRDGVFRHGASFGIAAADPVSRAAGDRDGVARHGSIIGMAAVGLARDRAAGERDGVIRRGAVTRPAAVGISDRAGRHIHPVLFHRAALGPAAINNPIVGRAALDEYMVLREDICPPNKQV